MSIEDLEKRVKELERLVEIHETFFKKQYDYDRELIMNRFRKIEKRMDDNGLMRYI